MALPTETVDSLLSRRNVQGVGRSPDSDRLIVFVTEKQPVSILSDEDVVPEQVDVEGTVYDTDVVGIGEVRTHDREGVHRPIPAGVSVGHPNVTAGTVGSPEVQHEDADESLFLTNAHVAAPVGEAAVGDSIIQPGPADDGTEEVGMLVEFSEISKDESNRTDSALVESPVVSGHAIYGREPPKVFAGFTTAPDPDASFVKSGRTTGNTEGSVLATEVSIDVRGYFPDDSARFEDVAAFTPMSSGGDSGSLIGQFYDGHFFASHLLFAGGPQATIAIPIQNVFEEHGVLEVGGEPPQRGDDHFTPSLIQRILRLLFGWLRS